jgi:hypothetical protein
MDLLEDGRARIILAGEIDRADQGSPRFTSPDFDPMEKTVFEPTEEEAYLVCGDDLKHGRTVGLLDELGHHDFAESPPPSRQRR